MDVWGGLWSLVLAWALLDRPLSKGESLETNGPCEQQLRYRDSSAEARGPWLSTLALLSSIGAIWLFVFYALHCLCARRNQCAQESNERSEKCWEDTQKCRGNSCLEEDMDRSSSYRSQVLVPAQAEFGSSALSTNPTLQVYAHQLACMENELEHFLSEVRNRQDTLEGKAGKEKELPMLKKWGSEKLRITVYEIADGEKPETTWGRGRKRRVK